MNDFREILGNATMAHVNMPLNVEGEKVVRSIFNLIEEDRESIKKANEIDVKNNNGFKINFEILSKMKKELCNIGDYYRKVIYMNKIENNYIAGMQTDKLGTVCLVYDGNTYCLLELVVKSILAHNSIIVVSEADYMKATNELILILVKRILEAYKIEKKLVQIVYTSKIEELLSNCISINKVIAIGNRDFQNNIRKISQVEVIGKGYNYFDIYIEDDANLDFIEEIVKENENNIDIYVKEGIKVPFEDYIEVADIDEAIAKINFSTAGYSCSIFTKDGQNATNFLREIKVENIFVNSSPIIHELVDVDMNSLILKKKMIYPSPLAESTEKNRIEFPTSRAILEKRKKP